MREDTSTNNEVQWKGLALPSTLESIIPFAASPSYDLLLGSDIIDFRERYLGLLEKLYLRCTVLSLYYPHITELFDASDLTPKGVWEYLKGDGFSESVYLIGQKEEFLCYSNARDNFSVCVIETGIVTESDVDDWDRAFVERVRQIGVGIGREGEIYLEGLLTELAQMSGPASRFAAMLEALQR